MSVVLCALITVEARIASPSNTRGGKVAAPERRWLGSTPCARSSTS